MLCYPYAYAYAYTYDMHHDDAFKYGALLCATCYSTLNR
jgi:hypothetical protein